MRSILCFVNRSDKRLVLKAKGFGSIALLVLLLCFSGAKKQTVVQEQLPELRNVISADLKKTVWFSTVKTEIEKQTYAINAAGNNRYSSFNPAQRLQATYTPETFALRSVNLTGLSHDMISQRVSKTKQDLIITIKGLYANDALVPTGEPVAVLHQDKLEYNFGDAWSIQYENSNAGIRQNFIVQQRPGNDSRELKIRLQLNKNWFVHKASDAELNFSFRNSCGSVDDKITYNDLCVWDASGKHLEARMEKESETDFAIVVNTIDAIYPLTIDPISTTADVVLNGENSGDSFGYSVSAAGDVNGDGYSDVIIGAPYVSSAAPLAGAAYLFLGSNSGLSATPAITLNGQEQEQFGSCVSGTGDINNDGFDDVIVGAWVQKGNAYVFLGSVSGLSSVPPVLLQ